MLVGAYTMSHAAETAVVLACEDQTHYLEADTQSLPVSLSITVNLANRTVRVPLS